MHIINMGVDYRLAPLEIRELFTFSETAANRAMIQLNDEGYVLENVILSTCNRTEIFAVVDTKDKGYQSMTSFLAKWFGQKKIEFMDYLQVTYDDEAIRHAFRLAVGLESMVLGETQILGQFKQAFFNAQQQNCTGKILNELFKRVITFAKRAHHETRIGEQAMSVSYIAVNLVETMVDKLENKHAVIIGAGDMGELTLKHLKSQDVAKITMLNRSVARADELAQEFHVEAVPLEQLEQVLMTADVLISSTAASDFILSKNQVETIQTKRGGKSLLLIDLAVPRDIESSVKTVNGVSLYDLDNLQHVARENMKIREEAASQIELKLDSELACFKEWVHLLDVVPLIRGLREKSIAIQENVLESIYRKIPQLDEREKNVLQKHTKSIIHQLLEQPLEQVKQMGIEQQPDEEKRLFQDIFGLEEDK